MLKMPVTTMRVNILGTYNVLEAALANGKLMRREFGIDRE